MASKRIFCCGGLLVALLVSGCANTYTAPLRPPSGALFTSQTIPITIDAPPEGLNLSGCHKVSSESFYLFWPYPIFDLAWGNPRALGAAAHSDRFASATYAEAEVFTIFGLFGHYTVNVYGPGQGH